MAANGTGNPGNNVFILYKVINSVGDNEYHLFNAFPMPRGQKPTLKTVKQ
jgi:hypothetical protein